MMGYETFLPPGLTKRSNKRLPVFEELTHTVIMGTDSWAPESSAFNKSRVKKNVSCIHDRKCCTVCVTLVSCQRCPHMNPVGRQNAGRAITPRNDHAIYVANVRSSRATFVSAANLWLWKKAFLSVAIVANQTNITRRRSCMDRGVNDVIHTTQRRSLATKQTCLSGTHFQRRYKKKFWT